MYKLSEPDKLKYINVGLTVFSGYKVDSFEVSQNSIVVKCNVTDKNDLQDLKTYQWLRRLDKSWVFRLDRIN